MVDVTALNFHEVLYSLNDELRKASFTCLDFEFSGLHSNNGDQISLFDSPSERYHTLSKSCRDFTVLQCGISIFCYDTVSRTYDSSTFNFFLYPRDFKTVKRQTYFESSATEFLTKYDFDFSKCFYGGISYLNEDEINHVQKTEDYSQCIDDIVLNDTKLGFKERKQKLISKWSSEARSGESLEIDCMTIGMLKVLRHDVLNNFDDLIPELVEGTDYILIVKKTSIETKEDYLSSSKRLADKNLTDAIGFTHVVRLLRKHKKPMIGHNLLLDMMYIYEKFYKPLPHSYNEFKTSIRNEFPPIYDTRHIMNNIKVELKADEKYRELLKGSSLLSLYDEVNSDGIRGIIYQPTIIDIMNNHCGMREHHAGYDSCLVGHVFIRLGHFYAFWKYNSPNIRPFHLQDYFREFSKFRNCLNLIRCDVTHINLDDDDPGTRRPQWLLVKSRDNSDIVEEHIAHVFSAFGNVDVRRLTNRKCIVAMPSIGMAAGLLVVMKNNPKYIVCRYDPQASLVKTVVLCTAVTSLVVVGGWTLAKSFAKQ